MAEHLGVKDVNAWKDGSVKVRFAAENKYVIITLSEISN